MSACFCLVVHCQHDLLFQVIGIIGVGTLSCLGGPKRILQFKMATSYIILNCCSRATGATNDIKCTCIYFSNLFRELMCYFKTAKLNKQNMQPNKSCNFCCRLRRRKGKFHAHRMIQKIAVVDHLIHKIPLPQS